MYLLVKEGKQFKLYCPETFGLDTWGSRHQTSLEKKRKYWYVTNWAAGNDYIDDSEESYRLNVVLETPDLHEVMNYVIKNTTDKARPIIESLLVQAQELYHERVAFEAWARSRNTQENRND